ncbi:MAG TPA: hypothetical protein VG870_11180 [Chitinophagaceae bacterium]|nr:hypothetical protein [Chitinophagaceae bacterium]
MDKHYEMEERLWDYIDGRIPAGERSLVSQLIESDMDWKAKYRELLELHDLVHATELQEPSLRFTKNVMEEIAKYQIAPATKSYINKKIIWGIGLFFITLIVGFLVYGFSQVDWSATSSGTSQYLDWSRIDFSKFFNNTYVNVFMMVNAVLGLMLLDRYLASRRKELHKQ